MSREAHDLFKRDNRFLRRMMRMRADRAEDIVMSFDDLDELTELPHARRDSHHETDARRFRPRENGIDLAPKRR